MATKNLTLLGSTGSIGTQTLRVIKELNNINVVCLTANKNIQLLIEQVDEFHPEVVCVMDEQCCDAISGALSSRGVKLLCGQRGLVAAASFEKADTVLNAVVGNVGLQPTMAAIEAGKDIALANKETLVSAGELVMAKAAEKGVRIIPVDSEHSAIFQCLQGNQQNEIYQLYLTASGGPFRMYEKSMLESVALEDALNHPNWQMGTKITIDSATLMNKGLEVIEAKWLFGVDADKIRVLVHPQSIIHSMVEFDDGAVMAQLGEPDMGVPISYALTYPLRKYTNNRRINFFERNTLSFEEPRYEDFPCLSLAFKALRAGGCMPAVLNAANEAAVGLFIEKKIGFTQIPVLIEKAMSAYNVKQSYSLQDVLDADNWARNYIVEVV